MAIGIEALLFLLGGIILALVLIKAFGRSGNEARARGAAQVRLERTMNSADGVEETRLLLNDQPILVASSAGVRLADYAAEVEQLEAIATHMASALGVTVEFTRLPSKGAQPAEEAVPVHRLPRNQQNGSSL
jgi:heme/copper-type cytochrome/quinol oxidase subunit 3